MHLLPLSRLRFATRTLCLLLLGGLLAAPLAAQTPETIAVLKIALYRQSAATPVLFGHGAVTQIGFVEPILGTATLRTPVATKNIPRDTSRTFSLVEAFISRDALDAQYPNGNYNIQIEGAGVNASYPFNLSASPPKAPTVTNFAEAQAIADPARFVLRWSALEDASPLDLIGVSIESDDGQFSFASPAPGKPGVLLGTATSLEVALPPNKRFTAEISFLRTSQVSGLGNTFVYVGWASATQFSLRTLGPDPVAAPVITAAPVALTVAPGSAATFSVSATGGGTLAYQWRLNGTPIPGATASTLTLPSVQAFQAGNYTVVVSNSEGSVTSPAAALTITTPPTPVGDARLANLSTRGQAGASDDSLIAGFVINGSGEKRVLIRGIGPGLEPFGLSPAELVADPTLTLFSGTGATIASNDDWSASAEAAAIATATTSAGAFALPGDSRDAVLLVTLAPGAYTAVVAGKSAAPGVAIVEVYDLDAATSGTRLVNIATRGLVGSGSRILIPGFFVSGTTPKKFVIRGIGPSLAAPPFDLAGTLADPVLSVYQGETVLFSNDDWSNNVTAGELVLASRSVGAFEIASGSRDSALLVTLEPGAYTFQLAGKGTATGIALVEVYEVP